MELCRGNPLRFFQSRPQRGVLTRKRVERARKKIVKQVARRCFAALSMTLYGAANRRHGPHETAPAFLFVRFIQEWLPARDEFVALLLQGRFEALPRQQFKRELGDGPPVAQVCAEFDRMRQCFIGKQTHEKVKRVAWGNRQRVGLPRGQRNARRSGRGRFRILAQDSERGLWRRARGGKPKCDRRLPDTAPQEVADLR